MKSLWESRKFRIMLVDVVISTAVYTVTKFTAPDVSETVLWLIGLWQPVIVSVVLGIAIEDHGEKSAWLYVEDVEE